MSRKSARREYLEAVAEFERACLAFSHGMAAIVPAEATNVEEITRPASALGPRKPARRARSGAGTWPIRKRSS